MTQINSHQPSYSCPLCDKTFDSLDRGLSRHFTRTHKQSKEELWFLLFSPNDKSIPTCACGCGTQMKFKDWETGFRKYVKGHAARVHNNWGHNAEAQKKSKETWFKRVETGELKPFYKKGTTEHWSKGLTKETDERMKQRSERIKNNPKKLKEMSERMSRNRKNGTVRTLKGKESGGWKGGHSSLNSLVHANSKLYSEWKYPILKASNFTCSECGLGSKDGVKLHVHHDKEKFADILREVARKNGWEEAITTTIPNPTEELNDLKIKISNEVASYHIDNKVSGVVVCKECHKKEHKVLNFDR